jgi:Cu-Zn family superoxide dismutase
MLARVFLAAAALTFAGCKGSDYGALDRQDEEAEATDAGRESEDLSTAIARIAPKSGSSVTGEATLAQEDGKLSITVQLSSAPPGAHAVHLHEKGDCSAPDASSAGGHWNPDGKPHGKRGSGAFHAGDLGNVEIGPDGTGSLSLDVSDWSLGAGSEKSPVGKAVVVHAQPDDFVTQPDGGGGQRIACGVVESGRN